MTEHDDWKTSPTSSPILLLQLINSKVDHLSGKADLHSLRVISALETLTTTLRTSTPMKPSVVPDASDHSASTTSIAPHWRELIGKVLLWIGEKLLMLVLPFFAPVGVLLYAYGKAIWKTLLGGL